MIADRPLQRGTAARTAVKDRYTKKYAKYIVYKTRGEKISDVTVHERWTCRVFVFGKVLFVRTKQ